MTDVLLVLTQGDSCSITSSLALGGGCPPVGQTKVLHMAFCTKQPDADPAASGSEGFCRVHPHLMPSLTCTSISTTCMDNMSPGSAMRPAVGMPATCSIPQQDPVSEAYCRHSSMF